MDRGLHNSTDPLRSIYKYLADKLYWFNLGIDVLFLFPSGTAYERFQQRVPRTNNSLKAGFST